MTVVDAIPTPAFAFPKSSSSLSADQLPCPRSLNSSFLVDPTTKTAVSKTQKHVIVTLVLFLKPIDSLWKPDFPDYPPRSIELLSEQGDTALI